MAIPGQNQPGAGVAPQKKLEAPKGTGPLGFSLVNDFKGYRNKEDMTNLPPGYLVAGSQNVMVNTSGQVQSRYGYTLDGQAGSPIGLDGFDTRFAIVTDPTQVTNANTYLYYDLSQAPDSFWYNVQTTGADIRVTLNDGMTEVALEVSGFDFTNRKGSLFFNSVGLTPSTENIYFVYSGNATATAYAVTDPLGAHTVWANFILVQHEDVSAADSSPGNNPGVVTGAVLTPAKLRDGYSFDGVDDNIAVANQANQLLTGGFVQSAWIIPVTIGETAGRVTDKSTGNAGNNGWDYAITGTAGLEQMRLRVNNGTPILSAASSVTLNTANKIKIVVQPNGTATHYINGVLSGTPGISAALSAITAATPLTIGNRSNNTDRTFNGIIDEVMITTDYALHTAAWELTEYKNQNNSSFWVTADTESVVSESSPILASFDWDRGRAGDRHIRAGAGNVEFRFVAQAGDSWKGHVFTENQVYWIPILEDQASDYWQFTTQFDFNGEKIDKMLGVNRQSAITEWSGGVGTIASYSANVIGMTGNNILLTSLVPTSTAPNVVPSFFGSGTDGSGSIVFNGQPSNGQTLVLTINGTPVTITFVTAIGATPGNVLIGANTAATAVNTLGLLQNPASTTATQVALSGPNQTLVAYVTYDATNGLTVSGDLTWSELGFYSDTSGRSVVINGTTYAYIGGEGTQTLTDVSPSAASEPVGSVVFQLPITTQNSAMTSIPDDFRNDLISVLNQQVYVGSLLENTAYISAVYDYTDYSQSTPREPGEGANITFDGLLAGFAPQESSMYVTWGEKGWSLVQFTLSADLMNESYQATSLKTAPLQAALAQDLITNIGNDLAFVTNEPTISTFGRVEQTLQTPQISNISDSIKNDMDTYGTESFTDGDCSYDNYFLYVSVPQQGIVRRYNLSEGWWEAPFFLPVAKFSLIDGSIYGHSYLTNESYQLNNGTNDNGNPINYIAAFAYEQFGERASRKEFVEFYVEGYISSNTVLNALNKFDFGGFNGISDYQISGTDSRIIFQTTADNSLGKVPLGSYPIGSVTDSILDLPKFRVIKTGSATQFYEYQPYFQCDDIDAQFALLAFGARVKAGNLPTEIRE